MSRDGPPPRSPDRDARASLDWTHTPTGLLAVALALLLLGSAVPASVAAADVPTFEDNLVRVRQGETATLNVSLPDGVEETRFSLGGDGADVAVVATAVDADGDGQVAVRLDTGNLTDATVTAAGDDDLRDVSVSGLPANDTLPGGDYDLALGPADGPTDVGTLFVDVPGESGTRTPTATVGAPDSTPTPTSKNLNGTVVVHTGRYVTLPNTETATVTGETHLPAGTELTVRIRSAGATRPRFFQRRTVTVAEDGTFTATFDLHDQRAGGNQLVDIAVVREGTVLTTATGRIRECSDCAATAEETPAWYTSDRLGFPEDVAHVVQTLPVVLPVSTGNASVVTLVVGDEHEVGYELVVRVNDSAGDPANGRAFVSFRTEFAGLSGRPARAVTDRDRDGSTIVSETSLNTVIALASTPSNSTRAPTRTVSRPTR